MGDVDAAPLAPSISGRRALDILNTTRDAFVAADVDGRVVEWNTAAAALFGYARDEAVGREVSELIIPPDQRQRHDAGFRRFVATGESALIGQHLRMDGMRSTGEVFPVEITHWSTGAGNDLMVHAFIRDVTEIAEQEREIAIRHAREAALSHRVMHDDLTGLANRALVVDRLEQELARRRRTRRGVAVLFVDLDRFKVVNDSYGHLAGDELLKLAAERIRGAVRGPDTVARVAGDEFVIVCTDLMRSEEAVGVADRVRDELRRSFDLGGQQVLIGASIGVAECSSDTCTAEEIIRDADAAMYRAKELGRDKIIVFDASMRQRLVNRLQLEREILGCVERGEMEVRYWPVVSVADGAPVAVRLWQCWNHPRLGLLEPPEFFSIAEDAGVLSSLTDWAIQEVCEHILQWRASGQTIPQLVFILSAKHLLRTGFLRRLTEAFTERDIPMDRAILGVDARTITPHGDASALRSVLAGVRDLGMALALGRFDQGTAVFPLLQSGLFDGITITGDLVAGIGADERSRVVVRGLAQLAAELGLITYAENIDSAEQRGVLAELGVKYGSGHGIGSLVRHSEVSGLFPVASR